MISGFEKALGKKPKSFAAPAWLTTETSLKLLDEFGFDYASDTRGRSPFYPVMKGLKFKTLQVPSTLPTMDELLAWDGVTQENAAERLNEEIRKSKIETHVHSIHTEVEGTALFADFSDWARRLKSEGARFTTVGEIAAAARANPQTPACEVAPGNLPGRAGPVSCQN